MPRFHISPLPCWCVVTAVVFSGCQPQQPIVHLPESTALQDELTDTKRKLEGTEKLLTSTREDLSTTARALEAANESSGEIKKALAERDAQIQTVKAEIEALKKREEFVFASISALQQEGQAAVALSRYEQFIRDYPNSPLTLHAMRVVAERTATLQRDAKRRLDSSDPSRPDGKLAKLFQEGLSTPQELAPLLKGKTRAQVLALLGRPSQTFADGADLGYADRAINPATGKKGMLIIAFQSDIVSSLRLEYAGRKIAP
jgi:hypothetical protein